MATYTLKIVDIRKETEDTLTLCFRQPALRKIKYKAGQYITLLFRINGRRYMRPYSFSSTPGVDPLLEITVKRIVNGIVSNHIHDQVQIGDSVEVMEPMGDFLYRFEDNLNPIYFWGIGSGITPLISLVKEVLTFNSSTNVILIYGNKDLESTIFSKQIDVLLNTFQERFKVWHFHTQLTLRTENPYMIEGRINKKDALNLLKEVDKTRSGHYICGPAGLKESVKEVLSTLGIPPEHVFSEDFALIKDPKEFDGISSQNIKLRFQQTEYTLEITKGKSILEAALDAGLELPYSCQTGNCNTCEAKCLSGDVKMIGLSKDRLDLKQDQYLLCCSHPLSANVYIEVK